MSCHDELSLLPTAKTLLKPAWNPPVSAWYSHGPFAFWLVEACQPRLLAELGTHWGYSYMAMCQAVADLGLPTRCCAVDTWQGDEHAGFYGEEVFAAVDAYNSKHYGGFSQLLRCSFDEAILRFKDASIDLLHIDGRHYYEDVRHDFETWLPKMSQQGIVIFHDTEVREHEFGVWRLWGELKQRYQHHFEFHHGHGLGILSVGNTIPEKLRPMLCLEQNSEIASQVRSIYCELGKRLEEGWQLQNALELERARVAEAEGALELERARVAEAEGTLELERARLSEIRRKIQQADAENLTLRSAVKSALKWQQRSSIKRAFHKWRPPSSTNKRVNVFRKIERSLRKRRKTVLTYIFGDKHARSLPNNTKAITAPSAKEWRSIYKKISERCASQKAIDVVVPVYKGFEETLRCLYSVLHSENKTPIELIVINDKSPDQHLVARLRDLSKRGAITLVENKSNRGFVNSTNRGMMLNAQRDVILLNSDTEVFGNWVDRLVGAAYSDHKIATVTPLTNNGTICSYPVFNSDNKEPECSFQQLDIYAESNSTPSLADVPTGVGFCMYIKRQCIQQIGVLDEVAFGKGYGEENDFCQRAIQHGWRNVVTPGVFVLHHGSTSFGQEKQELCKRNLKVLQSRYPNYSRDVAAFCKNDPLRWSRARIDAMRLLAGHKGEVELHITHGMKGGVERHIQELSEEKMRQGCKIVLLRGSNKEPSAKLNLPKPLFVPNLEGINVLDDYEHFVDVLRLISPKTIHVHHVHGHVECMLSVIKRLACDLNTALVFTIHDYHVICPRITLTNETGTYCGEPQIKICQACVNNNGSRFGKVDVNKWRGDFDSFLERCDEVIVPDQDVSERLIKYFPGIRFHVKPHTFPVDTHISIMSPVPGKVAIIGAVGEHKGFEVIRRCAVEAKRLNLNLHLCVIGYTSNDKVMNLHGVSVTGPYKEHEIWSLLQKESPQAIFLPSVLPETYSYTLSIALNTNLPVISFNLGAIGRRLRERNRATDLLLAPSLISDPEKVANEIAHFLENARRANTTTSAPSPTPAPAEI